jgi:hypothetical protein
MSNDEKNANRFWLALHALIVQVYYYESLLDHDKRLDNIISSLIAIGSSSSIVGWVIWKEYAFIWASFIAFTQIISVINKFLPYKQRLYVLPEILNQLQLLQLDNERLWLRIENNELTENEMCDAQIAVKKETQRIIISCFPEGSYKINQRIEKYAILKTDCYIDRYFY